MSDRRARTAARLVERLVTRLRGSAPRSPAVRRLLLLAAFAVFVGSSLIAFNNLPDDGLDLRPGLLVMAACCVPVTLAVNAWEFWLSAAIMGSGTSFRRAVEVSVTASAANSLPIPGAVAVKTHALSRLGQSYRRAVSSTAAVGITWVSMACLIAGVLLVASGDAALGAGMLVAAAAGLTASWWLLSAHLGRRPGATALRRVALVETASVALAGLRIYLLAAGVGLEVEISEAFSLAVAAIIASAIGIFPGGLGLREVLSAAVGRLTGLPPAVGLITSAFDRALLTAVLALVALGLAFARRGRTPDTVAPT